MDTVLLRAVGAPAAAAETPRDMAGGRADDGDPKATPPPPPPVLGEPGEGGVVAAMTVSAVARSDGARPIAEPAAAAASEGADRGGEGQVADRRQGAPLPLLTTAAGRAGPGSLELALQLGGAPALR